MIQSSDYLSLYQCFLSPTNYNLHCIATSLSDSILRLLSPSSSLDRIIGRVSLHKKSQFIPKLVSFWKLKRQSRNGVPLLRRMQASNHGQRAAIVSPSFSFPSFFFFLPLPSFPFFFRCTALPRLVAHHGMREGLAGSALQCDCVLGVVVNCSKHLPLSLNQIAHYSRQHTQISAP